MLGFLETDRITPNKGADEMLKAKTYLEHLTRINRGDGTEKDIERFLPEGEREKARLSYWHLKYYLTSRLCLLYSIAINQE